MVRFNLADGGHGDALPAHRRSLGGHQHDRVGSKLSNGSGTEASRAAAQQKPAAGARKPRSFNNNQRQTMRLHVLDSAPHTRSTHDLHIIDELLQQSAPMAALARGVRYGLARAARLRSAGDGEVVCRAGEPMDKIVIVISGELVPEVSRISASVGGTPPPAPISAFGCLGEQLLHQGPNPNSALSATTPRTPAKSPRVSISTSGAVTSQPLTWPVTYKTLSCMECAELRAEDVARVLEEEGSAVDLEQMRLALATMPLLAWLPREALEVVARSALVRRYDRTEVICKQGSDADELFLVKVGYVRMLRSVDMPPLSPRAQATQLALLQRECKYRQAFLDIDAPTSTATNADAPNSTSGIAAGQPGGSLSGDSSPRRSGSPPRSPRRQLMHQHQQQQQQQQQPIQQGQQGQHGQQQQVQKVPQQQPQQDTAGEPGPPASAVPARISVPRLQLPQQRPSQLQLPVPDASPSTSDAPSTEEANTPIAAAIKAALRPLRTSSVGGAFAGAMGGAEGRPSAMARGRRYSSDGARRRSSSGGNSGSGDRRRSSGGRRSSSSGGAMSHDSRLGGGAWVPRKKAVKVKPWAGQLCQRFFAEVGLLGPNQSFGEVWQGDAEGKRRCSAVADTPTEVFVIRRYDLQQRLEPHLVMLLQEALPHDAAAQMSDEELRRHLLEGMQWESQKQEVVVEALTARGHRQH